MSQYLYPQLDRLKSKIKHVVVLMLENRSFDNLLGWLYDGETIPDGQEFEGLKSYLSNPFTITDGEGNPIIEQVPVAKNGVPVKRAKTTCTNEENYFLPNPDPGEGFADTNHQLFLSYKVDPVYPPMPLNNGFVQNYHAAMQYGSYILGDTPTDPRDILTCYTPKQTPVLSQLAKNFAVLDQYFASVPSQTLPNRSFVHAGTSDGHVNNAPYTTTFGKTIFNWMDESNQGLTWGIYGDNPLKSGEKDTGSQGGFKDNHFSLTRLCMKQLQSETYDGHFGTMADFYAKCKSGKLDNYTFLEPLYSGEGENDQHPPHDIRLGEILIAEICNAVRNSPAFNETLLVITYDEHGGCYDHFPPPGYAQNPSKDNAQGQDGFLFNRFGLRVPCVIINPYVRKGRIARCVSKLDDNYYTFDHTSVIKTVQNCFGLSGELTSRSKAAPDFSCVLELDTPRSMDDMPEIVPPQCDYKADTTKVNGLQRLMAKMLSELTGTSVPADEMMQHYIHTQYHAHFGKKAKKGGASKGKKK